MALITGTSEAAFARLQALGQTRRAGPPRTASTAARVAGAGALARVLDERPQLAHHERAAVPRFERPDLGTLEHLLDRGQEAARIGRHGTV